MECFLSAQIAGLFLFRDFFFNRCKIHIKLPLNRLTTEDRVENVNSVVTCLISQIPTLFEKGSKRIFMFPAGCMCARPRYLHLLAKKAGRWK